MQRMSATCSFITKTFLNVKTTKRLVLNGRTLLINSSIARMSTSTNKSKVVIDKSLTFCNNNWNRVNESNENSKQKQNSTLVIMFAWMLANDKHLEKYNKLYSKYGYDVLFVKTFPFQLFLPKFGAIKNAENVVQFVSEKTGTYSNIIVHGFSVGAYQFGEVLVKLSNDTTVGSKIFPLFKGCILDSGADINAIPFGFSTALTSNKLLQKCFYYFLKSYLKLCYPFATKFYYASQDQVYQMYHFQVPGLILISEADRVGGVEANSTVIKTWRQKGIPVTVKIWKDSKHVSHYYKHPEEYEKQLETFLKQIDPNLK